MNNRVYIGRIPDNARDRDVERFFKGYGRIREILLKNGYGFVEFEDSRDADDAVYDLNGKLLCGERIIVERARSPGSRTAASYDRRPTQSDRVKPPLRTPYRVIVENISSRTSWQELKDHLNRVGEVTFADAHKEHLNEGVAEFATLGDMKNAVTKLDNTELNGRKIHVYEDARGGSRRKHSRSRSRERHRSDSRHRNRSRSRSARNGRSRSGSRQRTATRRSRTKSPSASPKRHASMSPRASRSPSPHHRSRSRHDSRHKSASPARKRDRSRSHGSPRESKKREKRSGSRSESRQRPAASNDRQSPSPDRHHAGSCDRSRSPRPASRSRSRSPRPRSPRDRSASPAGRRSPGTGANGRGGTAEKYRSRSPDRK